MATLKDLERTLRGVGKQLKFAHAQALTKVARKVEQAERKHLEQTFDNPTPFTLKSIKSIGARRDNLQAKVFIQSIAEKYLDPYGSGGVRYMSGKTMLNPKEVRLNKYGNLARNRTKTLMAREDVFSGEVGGVRGIWQRKKKRGSTKRKRSRRAIASKQKGNLKLLIRFCDPTPVKQRMDFYGVAEETINRELPSAMQEAIQKAFETAR